MTMPKTYSIRTYGCQMNELDTEVMAGILERRGLQRANDEELADIQLFNTCSIRDLAERKAMGKIGKLTRSPKKGSIIGVTGCMANAKKESLFRKLPGIDFVLGTNNIHELNQVLDEVLAGGRQVMHTDDKFSFELDYRAAKRNDKIKAYVSIIRGCNKFCTYCVVPYTRGPEVSRDPNSVIEEIKKLAGDGCREVTLLGQNVNSYGKDQDWNVRFHDLLARIDSETDIARVRFMTSHPVDITQELMEAVRDLDSLCEFIHFPLQAGSDRILRKMHRIYKLQDYLDKVEMFRSICPNVCLGTDIIVGFPTETEEEFQMTYDRMKELRFSVAFIFAYSQRKGTPAMRWKDDIPEEVKQQRLQKLMELQESICAEERHEFLGKTVEVLVDKANPKDLKQLRGRTRCWKKVVFEGDLSLIGTLQNVKVHSCSNQTLLADPT